MNDSDIYAEYASLKVAESEIKTQLESLAQIIKKDMVLQQKKNKVKTKYGTFSIMNKKSWEYTESVKYVEDSISDLKKSERQKGLATCKTNPILTFKKK